MLSKRIFFILILGALANFSGFASAQSSGAQFGIMYGLSVPDSSSTNPRSLYGVKGSALLTESLSLGGYYLIHNTEEGSDGRKFDYSLHGIEGAYRKTKGSGSTFVGIRAGLSKIRERTTAGDSYILSPYHYGIVTGHDFHVMKWLSIGFEGSYLALERSSTQVSGVDYEEDAFNIISFFITFQFRL